MTGVSITVLGGGREVGRAAVLLSYGDKKILFDYGIGLGEDDIPVLPLPVKPAELSAVAITHSHLDHVGAAPFLYISRRIPTVMTGLTRELSRIMITDMLKLAGYYLPFEYPELNVMLESVVEGRLGSTLEVSGIPIDIINAGHIPGSAMFRVEVGGRYILYTGDVNTIDTRLVKGADLSGIEANVVVIESTYGNVDHPPRSRVEERFIEVVKEVVEDGGVVLIPAFALGRSQEILCLLAEKMPYANVYYDGMARQITEILLNYRRCIHRPDLLEKAYKIFTPVPRASLRKKILKEPGAVIVTPAGMLKGGPALYYIKRMWSDRRSALIFVSFQAPSTPGRRVLEEGVFEELGPRVQARVMWFDFSSHAGVSGLLGLLKSVKGLEEVVVIHGGDPTVFDFAALVEEELGVKVHTPSNGETIELG